jgi:hypothetical protein
VGEEDIEMKVKLELLYVIARDRFPVRAREFCILHIVQINSEVYPDSYPLSAGAHTPI